MIFSKLMILQRKTFDAVYYHVRSLMSSNSIQSANESLQEIFDKIKKKVSFFLFSFHNLIIIQIL